MLHRNLLNVAQKRLNVAAHYPDELQPDQASPKMMAYEDNSGTGEIGCFYSQHAVRKEAPKAMSVCAFYQLHEFCSWNLLQHPESLFVSKEDGNL